MSVIQGVAGITGQDEIECFILLCMQSCAVRYIVNPNGMVMEKFRLAYIVPTKDKVVEEEDGHGGKIQPTG